MEFKIKIVLVLLYFMTCQVYANDFYIYTIDNKCQVVFPDDPEDFGTMYKYHKKDSKMYYKGQSDRFDRAISISDIKLMNKARKSTLIKWGYEVLSYNYKINKNVISTEYITKDNNNGTEKIEYNFEIIEGDTYCKWIVGTYDTLLSNKAQMIFDTYKQNIKFK